MTYQLSNAEQLFITNFITNMKKAEKKKQVNAFTEYCRRASKVRLEMEKLEADSAARQDAERELLAAKQQADLGNFKQAYKSLDAVKKRTRKVAKGYVEGIDPGQILLDAQALNGDVDRAWHTVRDFLATANDLVLANPDLDGSDIRVTMQALTVAEASLPQLINSAGQAKSAVTGLDAARILARMNHQLDVVEANGNKKQKKYALQTIRDYVADTDTEARIDPQDLKAGAKKTGVYIWDVDLDQVVTAAEDKLQDLRESGIGARIGDLLGDIEDPNRPALKKTTMTVKRAPAKEGEKGKEKEDEEVDALVGLARREQDRLAWAKREMKEARERDLALLPPDPSEPLEKVETKKPIQLRTFQAEDLEIEDPGDDLSPEKANEVAGLAALKLGEVMASESQLPNSDVIFDLLKKTSKDFAAMVGDELAFPSDSAEWTTEQSEFAKTVADKLFETMVANSPNTLSEDGSTLKMGDKTYKKDKHLAKGGLGSIDRYLADDGSKVIVKSLLREDQREDMVSELDMHRRAMGGEQGQGHPNLVGLRGVAVDPKGTLVMMLDEAEAGSSRDVTKSMLAATESGILSKSARDALTRNMFLEMAEGLKHIKDCNLTHNDIKGANFLVNGDGTIQVSDLGSAREMDDDGMREIEETEEGRQARETLIKQADEKIEELRKEIEDPSEEPEHDENSPPPPTAEEQLKTVQEQLKTVQEQKDILEKGGRAALKLVEDLWSKAKPFDNLEAYKVKGGRTPTTMAFQSAEVDNRDTHSSKSDVFMLGAALDMMTKDIYESELSHGFDTYMMNSRQTGHGGTALNRLVDSMLRDKPGERPTMDTVLTSAYVDKADSLVDIQNEAEQDDQEGSSKDGQGSQDDPRVLIKTLQKAVAQYSAKAGKRVAPLTDAITASKRRVLDARRNLDTLSKSRAEQEKSEKVLSDALDEAKLALAALLSKQDKAKGGEDVGETLDVIEKQIEEQDEAVKAAETKHLQAAKKLQTTVDKIGTQVKALTELERKENAAQIETRKKIDAIHEEPEIKPLVEAMREAGKLMPKDG